MESALAHGGISALGALRPVVFALALFGAAVFGWLVASVWILSRPATRRLGRIGAGVYGTLSALVFGMALLASVTAGGVLVAPLVLAFVAVTIAVPLVALKVFARRRPPGPDSPAAG